MNRVHRKIRNQIAEALNPGNKFSINSATQSQNRWTKKKNNRDALYRFNEVLHIITHVPICPPARVLEIGAGNGKLLYCLSRLGYEMAGANHEYTGYRNVENFPGVEYYNFHLAQPGWPLKSEAFDMVVANHVIEHLHITPKFFLNEIMRLLKPGGWVHLLNPNPGRLLSRLRIVFGKRYYPMKIEQHFKHFGQSSGRDHVREFLPSELHYMLIQSGFKNIRSGTCNLSHLQVPAQIPICCARLLAVTTSCFPTLRLDAYAVAQK